MPQSTNTIPAVEDLTGKVRKIGSHCFANGGLADIWKGVMSRRGSKEIVAIKVIRSVWRQGDYFDKLKMRLLREARVWSQLEIGVDTNYIVPLYGISFDLGVIGAPCLVSPYYKNGNVESYLKHNPLVDRISLIWQVSSGLAFLHDKQIIHGDMKSSNVLVSDAGEARISDFGLSRILETSGFTTKGAGGTCRWMAYELIVSPDNYGEDGEEYVPQPTIASDVWAFGMTALEILTGKLPFYYLKFDTAVILAVMKGVQPRREPSVSREVWTVLDRCWDKNPTQRPSMKTVSETFKSSSWECENNGDGEVDMS